jgi:hypothetical protein
MISLIPTYTYSVVQDGVFISIVGGLCTVIGALSMLIYTHNGKINKLVEALDNLTKSFVEYLADRKEKDKDFYRWKEKVDEVKTQHDMLTRAGMMLKTHQDG